MDKGKKDEVLKYKFMADDSRVYPRAASKHVDATTVMHPVESEASGNLAAKF